MGERDLIERAWRVFKRDSRELLGLDDAQAAELCGRVVFKVDVFDELTDWLPGMSLSDVGWRAVVAAVSDVLVKGARPLGVLLGLGLPEDSYEVAEELFKGVEEACDALGARVWGGDTGHSDHLYLAVAALGVAERLISRGSAKPGEALMLAGHEILKPVAYAVLLRGAEVCEGVKEALQLAFRPRPVKPEFWLEACEYATASIDDSDGLAETLHQLAGASRVKLVLERVPASPLLLNCAEQWGEDPLDLALYCGGEEYTFLFTVKDPQPVLEIAKRHGVSAWLIGRVEEGEGVYLEGYGEVERRGWEHFVGWRSRGAPAARRL